MLIGKSLEAIRLSAVQQSPKHCEQSVVKLSLIFLAVSLSIFTTIPFTLIKVKKGEIDFQANSPFVFLNRREILGSIIHEIQAICGMQIEIIMVASRSTKIGGLGAMFYNKYDNKRNYIRGKTDDNGRKNQTIERKENSDGATVCRLLDAEFAAGGV